MRREHTRRQPVLCVIGLRDRFIIGRDFNNAQHRPENLVARPRITRARLKDRRRHKRSVCLAAHQRLALQILADFLAMACIDQRTQMIGRIKRIAHLPIPHPRQNPLHQRRFDVAMHNQPRSGGAILAHVPKRRIHHMLGHIIQMLCIRQDHRRVLAAALQHHLFEIAVRRIAQEMPPRLRRASKADHIHIHMPPKWLSDRWPISGQHLQHTAWHTSHCGQFRHPQRRHRRLFCRLHDHRAPRRQRWPDLPRQHQQRKIPRQHRRDHTHRLTHNHRDRIITRRPDLIVNLVRRLRMPLDAMDRLGNIHRLAIANGLAALKALQNRQFALAPGDVFAQLDQHILASRGMHPRPMPLIKCLACLADGQIHIRRRSRRDFRQFLARRWIERRHHRPAPLAEFPVNERRAGQIQISGNRAILCPCQQIGHISPSRPGRDPGPLVVPHPQSLQSSHSLCGSPLRAPALHPCSRAASACAVALPQSRAQLARA